MLLISALVRAEDQIPSRQSAIGENAARQTSKVEVYGYYSELRRGTTEQVAVVLLLSGGFVTVQDSPVAGIVPVSLELKPSEDISVSKLRYPKPHNSKIASPPNRVPAIYFPIRFTLRARRTARLGARSISGLLRYQVVDDKGISPLQEIRIEIPLAIVGHQTRVHRDQSWPFTNVSKGEIVLMVILSPIILPFALACAIFMDGCG